MNLASVRVSNAVDHSRNNVAFALDRADNNRFAVSTCTAEIAATAWPLVFILGLSADIGFVHFDVANQLLELGVAERDTNLAAHEPCGFVRTETHVAKDLQRAHPLFAGEHEVHNAEPIAQRLVRILKDRAHENGKAIAATIRRAHVAIPMMRLGMLMHIVIAAARAARAIGPAIYLQILAAGVLVWELLLELVHRHLMYVQVGRQLALTFGQHGSFSYGVGELDHV